MTRIHKIIVSNRSALLKKYTIMILGAPDVVPHITVTNLTRDEDVRIIDSDLPYACDAGFHRDARRFLAPTRVVGRLPDINGGGDPRVARPFSQTGVSSGSTEVPDHLCPSDQRRPIEDHLPVPLTRRRFQLAACGHTIDKAVEQPRTAGRKVPPARHRKFSKLARENGFRDFTASVLRFGDRQTRETHYSYIEKRSRQNSRHKPRIIVFKETGTQIDVRVYRRK